VHEVLVLMASLASEGMTMLLVTHEIAFARDVSSRVLVCDKGVIGVAGSPDILRHPESDRLKQFLHRILHDQVGHSRSNDSDQGGQA
jgi:polar amino acid transport system ATP-binding protein